MVGRLVVGHVVALGGGNPKSIIKVLTMINSVAELFELMCEFDDNKVTIFTNLEIMCLTRYPGCIEMHRTTDLDFLVLSLKKYCIRLNTLFML